MNAFIAMHILMAHEVAVKPIHHMHLLMWVIALFKELQDISKILITFKHLKWKVSKMS